MPQPLKLTFLFFFLFQLTQVNAQVTTDDQLKAIDLFNRANEKIEFRDYENAVELYTEALAIWPKFKEAFKNRGIANSLLKKNSEAIADFDEALILDPNDAGLHNFRGFAKAEIGFEKEDHQHFEEAMKDIDLAISLNPEYSEAYLNKGIILMWLDRHREAIDMFNKVIEFNPQNAKAYYDRGLAYDKIGNLPKACLDWGKAKRLNFPMAFSMLSSRCE